MKTEYLYTSFKDNLATAAVLAATVIAMFGAMGNSTDAHANHAPAIQKMETIEVTAPRVSITRMDTIVVTASRDNRIVVASN